jgi:hypothetical protein
MWMDVYALSWEMYFSQARFDALLTSTAMQRQPDKATAQVADNPTAYRGLHTHAYEPRASSY